MKFRSLFLAAAGAILLAGCSLSPDITPPPGYVSPTPLPTLGNPYPQTAPVAARGAAFFPEKCAPCHGSRGLGNGPLAAQMPVAVPAIALRDISNLSTPAEWYALITQGRIDRGMPGFLSLSESQRWDVLAYVYSLGTAPQELQQGASLYAANCSLCHGDQGNARSGADLTDQAKMSQVSGTSMFRTISQGSGDMPAFSPQLSDADIWALTAYLRTFTFDLSAALPEAPEASATPTVAATPAPTVGQSPDTTPGLEASPTSTAPLLHFVGTVTNGSGTSLPADLQAVLHVYDTAANLEGESVSTLVQPDGSYQFGSIQVAEESAYWVSVDYSSLTYESQAITYDGSTTTFDLPVRIYDATRDLNTLSVEQVHINFSLGPDAASMQVVEIYVFINPSNQSVIVPTDGTSLPFVETPLQAADVKYQLASGSAPLIPAPDGFAMLPTTSQYGIVAFYTMTYDRRLEFSHAFSLPVKSVLVLVPEGMKVRSDLLEDGGSQDIGGTNFHMYQGASLASGSSLDLTLSGRPGGGPGFTLTTRTGLLIGLGALGLVLIVVGVVLFLRERRREQAEDEQEFEDDSLGEDKDSIMDAILALDDQFKAGGIPKPAYEKRRDELKARLKEII